MLRVTPSVSVSWKASLPMSGMGTWPVNTTMGTESMNASAIPVTVLVAPGPLVTNTVPTWPVALA